jgi:hypothetical protein
MNREREPGSVIHDRILAKQEANTRVLLGAVERKCLSCGKTWIGPAHCGQGNCRGIEFEERDVRPTTMQLWGQGITAVVEPPKPRALASETDLDALRGLRAALVETAARLVGADAATRRLVNQNSTNHAVFGFLQEALNQFTQGGDYELRVIDPLKMVSLLPVIRGLVAEIDRTLHKFAEESKK